MVGNNLLVAQIGAPSTEDVVIDVDQGSAGTSGQQRLTDDFAKNDVQRASSNNHVGSHRDVSTQLQYVQSCISKVEGNINTILEEVKQVKGVREEGWQQETIALRHSVEQLQLEKLQLRELEMVLVKHALRH